MYPKMIDTSGRVHCHWDCTKGRMASWTTKIPDNGFCVPGIWTLKLISVFFGVMPNVESLERATRMEIPLPQRTGSHPHNGSARRKIDVVRSFLA